MYPTDNQVFLQDHMKKISRYCAIDPHLENGINLTSFNFIGGYKGFVVWFFKVIKDTKSISMSLKKFTPCIKI